MCPISGQAVNPVFVIYMCYQREDKSMVRAVAQCYLQHYINVTIDWTRRTISQCYSASGPMVPDSVPINRAVALMLSSVHRM